LFKHYFPTRSYFDDEKDAARKFDEHAAQYGRKVRVPLLVKLNVLITDIVHGLPAKLSSFALGSDPRIFDELSVYISAASTIQHSSDWNSSSECIPWLCGGWGQRSIGLRQPCNLIFEIQVTASCSSRHAFTLCCERVYRSRQVFVLWQAKG
jgi:hypothetical protein